MRALSQTLSERGFREGIGNYVFYRTVFELHAFILEFVTLHGVHAGTQGSALQEAAIELLSRMIAQGSENEKSITWFTKKLLSH